MTLPLDYPTLRVIWWALLGVLLAGFAIMDGFDLGVGMLLLRVARTDTERRVVLNTIGPVWEGNQVWLLLGAGAIFAAWPEIYAVTFSGFYFAMLLVLAALILRPVGFKYRSKMTSAGWRGTWDVCLFLGGLVPALVFGIALGNVLQGVPFHFDDSMRSFYTGSLLGLFNPFALLSGFLSVSMLCMHGGVYLGNKTEGQIQLRAVRYGKRAAVTTIVLFALLGIWVAASLKGYAWVGQPVLNGASNPLHKSVTVETGAWIKNYLAWPATLSAPILGFLGALMVLPLLVWQQYKMAWMASALSIAGVISTVGVSMFPFILPSSTHPNMSLTVWDASSSHLTLFIMLIAAIIFVPVILLYTGWVYRVMRGKVTENDVRQNESSYY